MREPWSGEIRVTCLQLFGLYITVAGVTGGRGYTGAVIKHQTVNNLKVVLLLLAYLDEWGVLLFTTISSYTQVREID